MNRKKPEIKGLETIANTRLFKIERVKLQFGNGNEVEYERLRSPNRGAVMVVPILDDTTVFLIREYCAGLDRYEISFPKGVIDEGETPEEAADRELKEEIGYGAHELKLLRELSVAPGYSDFRTHVVLARGLYPMKMAGDEPEELEVIPWPLADLAQLLSRNDFVEARSIAALYLLQYSV